MIQLGRTEGLCPLSLAGIVPAEMLFIFRCFISYLSLVLGGPRYHNITLARGRQLIADQFSSNHTTQNLLLSIGQSRSKRFRKEQNYLRSSNVTRPEGLKLQTKDLIGHPGRRR